MEFLKKVNPFHKKKGNSSSEDKASNGDEQSKAALRATLSKTYSRRRTVKSFRNGLELDLGQEEPFYRAFSKIYSSKVISATPQFVNGTARGIVRAIPDVNGIDELIAEQVAKKPNHIAVIGPGGEKITYADLDKASDAWAVHLQSLGVGPGVSVAILTERNADMFIGLMGILKSGGAIVPLDALYPEAHISNVLQESDCKFIIAEKALQSSLPENCTATVLDLGKTPPMQINGAKPKKMAKSSDPMAIFFTSGTTGRPKGVLILRSNSVAFMVNEAWDALVPEDIMVQASSHCFVGCFNDIWLPLVRGLTAVVAQREVLLSPASFRGLRAAHGITATFLTPKVLELYADTDPDALDGMSLVQFAGEAVRKDAVETLSGRIKHLQHLYGCTEHNGCITAYEVPPEGVPAEAPRVPIGPPIANCNIHIFDPDMNPVEEGEAGELYVSGPQVTGGYLNRPDATAEKFVELPGFGRAYRTGDLARWLPGGLDLLGRIDRMVKVNGYRVELGDIESAAMKASEVGIKCTAAAAVVAEDGKLALYVCPETVNKRELQRFVGTKLPYYSVPTYVVPIPALPLNPNGKLDTRKLPAPGTAAAGAASPPDGELEMQVAQAHSNILPNLEDGPMSLDMESTFAELGGNSLQLVALLSALQAVEPRLQFDDLLTCDTVRSVANKITELRAQGGITLPPELVRISTGPAIIFALHGGLGRAAFGSEVARELNGKATMYCIEASEAAIAAAKASQVDFLCGLSEYYAGLIKAAQPEGPYTIAGLSMGGMIGYEVVRLLEEAGDVVERWIPCDMVPALPDTRAAFLQATCEAEKGPLLVANALDPVRLGIDPGEFKSAWKEMERKVGEYYAADPADPAVPVAAPAEEGLEFIGRLLGEEEAYKYRFLRELAPVIVCANSRNKDSPTIKAPVVVGRPCDDRLMRHCIKIGGLTEENEDYGWGKVTSGDVKKVYKIPGDHVTMAFAGKELADMFLSKI